MEVGEQGCSQPLPVPEGKEFAEHLDPGGPRVRSGRAPCAASLLCMLSFLSS